MRSQIHLIGHDRRARGNVAIQLSFLLFLALASPLHAQVGNQNPSGVSGIFNGQVNTGCSYDPYTGNAMRSITDIAVAGAVGQYPLALVRTANSRSPSTTEVFGFAGGWNHNYNWILEDSPNGNAQNFQPKRYTVEFPDGRVETFRAVTWDPEFYRVRPGADTPAQSTSAGVRERFVPLNTSTMLAYLILPDGGKIEFTASQHASGSHYYYKYHATAIIDPYGLRTQLVDEIVPNGTRRRLVWVIEPAGRYLHFFYVTANGPKISYVTANDGRTVNYYYIYCNDCRLDHVLYYNYANWTARYNYCNSNVGQGLPPLLWTADDPMYAGPMKRIAYTYRTANNPDGTAPVYGQIQSENYYDGTNVGVTVSTLTVGAANPTNHNIRTERRGDNATRTFTYYSSGYLSSDTDFLGHGASQTYDANKWINSVTDRNSHTTIYTCDPVTGNATQIQYPFTHSDTPNQTIAPAVNFTYTNNYYLHTSQDEGGNATTITRDANNRITRIDYPDTGYETFSYDAGHFYQLSTHRMKTGGTESFTYNGRASLRDTYRSPDNPSGSPTASYQYDSRDRVSAVTDVLGQITSFSYDLRGQLTVTTLPSDPVDGQRHTIKNYYNPDGTIYAKENELYQATNYTYDDYRRLKTVTPPVRGFGDTNTNTTTLSYYVNGVWDDYSHTESNVCWVHLPSGKWINTVYDDNRRKTSVTVGSNTPDAAMTSYGYDGAGNLTSAIAPNEQPGQPFSGSNTTTVYDERNRPWQITDALNRTTTIEYDTSGRKYRITRPNGQVITYDSYDAMNRVLQQTATSAGTTKYTYYTIAHDGPNAPVGMLHTMQDPHLVGINSNDQYTYTYDNMGRKTSLTYPLDSDNAHRTEQWTYDSAGRLWKFTNRNGKVQTFTYDALNRMTRSDWSDSTPDVTFGYDTASRLIEIDNANATIFRGYFYDNLLHTETESITGGRSKTVTYTYDADGNRATTTYPDGNLFGYTYTNRNQLMSVTNFAGYWYDKNGNLIQRNPANATTSAYTYDALDRVTSIVHHLNGTTRTMNYGYYPASNNRKWTQRLISPTSSENNKGDVFSYDVADQVTAVRLDIQNPTTANPGNPTITYDPNGNRIWFQPPGHNEQYFTNNLNQYTSRNSVPPSVAPDYSIPGNMTTGLDGSTYSYDAQNRLLSASESGVMMSFKYDGLNRQVSRTVGNTPTYNVYDGWDLIEEYQAANNGAMTVGYLYGPGGLIAAAQVDTGQLNYYYQDGSGSTSHLADSTGHLLEWYQYDLQGTPFFYDANDNQLSATNYSVRHLFTGQQWYSDIGLYDLRNRFYSPDIGRFLQPDGIGFSGDPTNLYRYAGNNPVIGSDPMGLDAVPHSGGYFTYVAYWPWNRLVGSHIVNGSEWLQCAGAARFLGGGYVNGVYYNMPEVGYWRQGATLSRATAPGTVVATGWVGGRYPSAVVSAYTDPTSPLYGQTINHALVFQYIDKEGRYHLFSQNPNGPIYETKVPGDQASQYSEVYVDKSNGPYESTRSDRSVANGNGASGNTGLNTRVPSIIGGIYYPFGFGNMSPNLNFAGGRAGTMQGAFTWGQIGDGSTPNGQIIGLGPDMPMVMEPGIGPGSCFVAGTPVLTADGSEKPIESIEVGELVLAWNEETKQIFSTKVAKTLHHEEKLQTLFDIELEDSRKFTVNNDHPIYVVEDGHFTFSDELAARFAKGEPITFQDNKNQPVKVAGLRMRREKCKMYNLHVEGQGKNGHTYYASGILVHNIGSGYKWK